MSQSYKRLAATAALATFFVANLAEPVSACTLVNNHIFPTNFEMVADTDAIVVARAVREGDGKVLFLTQRVLKGKPPRELRNMRVVFGTSPAENERELIRPHPDSYGSGCSRGTYEVGAEYVLFLKKGERGWRQGYAFSRTAENYYGPESLWIKTIEYYLDVQSKRSDKARRARLKRDYGRFSKAEPESDETIMALDIAWHLYRITPWKSFAFLRETYEALLKGQTRPHAVMSSEDLAVALGLDGSVLGMTRRRQFDWSPDFSRFIVLLSMEVGHEGKTGSFVRNLVRDNPRPHENEVGQMFRLLVTNGYVDEAIEFAEDNMLRVVTSGHKFSAWEMQRALTFSVVPIEHFLAFHEGARSHGSRWAEFILAIDVAWVRRFHQRWNSVDHVSLFMLLPDEPRDRPEVMRAMARAGMREAREWAQGEIDLYVEDDGEGYDYRYLGLPVDVLIHGYDSYNRDETRALTEKSFCAHEGIRIKMIRSLRYFMTGETQDLAVRIANYPDLTPFQREAMEITLAAFVGAGHHSNIDLHSTMDILREFQETGKVTLADYERRSRAPMTCEG